jgi:Fuc2NAc and GlcNAc transferase
VGLWIAPGLFAGLLSFFACNKARNLAVRLGMIIEPGERQSHQQATPTGGGLGLMFSILTTTLFLQLLIPLPDFYWRNMLPGFLILVIIGWHDDRFSVSSLLRFFVQLAVSIWLIGFGWIGFSVSDVGLMASGTVATVWMMNLYNFMDGSNGMAGFQGVFAGLVMAVLFQLGGQPAMALIALAVAAACLGFVPLNFPRAKVFMGDVASVPLGLIFSSFAVYGYMTGSISLSSSFLIMSVFIVDATLTLLTRVIRGERWYTAHAQHVYQRLIAYGWSHRHVLVVYQAINVVLVLPAIVLAELFPQLAFVAVGYTLLTLGTCWYIARRRLAMIATVQLK